MLSDCNGVRVRMSKVAVIESDQRFFMGVACGFDYSRRDL